MLTHVYVHSFMYAFNLAAGGIRTGETARAMIAAGASRLGASSSRAIIGSKL
jgi:deoxyribose-phosphate aldolase